jgi:hypothetical protein
MRFELARLFLMARKQVDAFERRKPNGQPLNREEWLRAVLSEPIEYTHRNSSRWYVPDRRAMKAVDRIVARIGRKKQIKENDPENDLKEFLRDSWTACLLIIDPSSHDDGQKVAIEQSSGIGSGYKNLESLIAHINSFSPPEPYFIELHHITDQSTFWDYVNNHKGKITSITLEVTAPNMFGGEGSFEEDVRKLRDREKARRIKETIENEDGLEPDTDRMRDAVSYATRGGGRVRAKAKNAPAYDSNEDRKFIDAEVDREKRDVGQKTLAAIEAFERDSDLEKRQPI